MARTKLKVTGMTCNHCTHAVKVALEGLDGVRSARVDLDAGAALVDYDDSVTGPPEMGVAVADAGYQAEPAQA